MLLILCFGCHFQRRTGGDSFGVLVEYASYAPDYPKRRTLLQAGPRPPLDAGNGTYVYQERMTRSGSVESQVSVSGTQLQGERLCPVIDTPPQRRSLMLVSPGPTRA